MLNNRIAFQGEPGAYSEEALFLLRPDAASLPCREFRDVAAAVLESRARYGLLPIENSLVGSIATNFDLIADSGLAIVGEVVSPVHHCLLAVRGAARDTLRRVLSHPVALAQCERFLSGLADVEVVAFYDTAGGGGGGGGPPPRTGGGPARGAPPRRPGPPGLVPRGGGEAPTQTTGLLLRRGAAPPP